MLVTSIFTQYELAFDLVEKFGVKQLQNLMFFYFYSKTIAFKKIEHSSSEALCTIVHTVNLSLGS